MHTADFLGQLLLHRGCHHHSPRLVPVGPTAKVLRQGASVLTFKVCIAYSHPGPLHDIIRYA